MSTRPMRDKEDDENIKKIGELFVEMIEERQKFMDEYYPTDIPNDVCNHALIKGIKFENSYQPNVHDFTPLMTFEDEELYVWTHTEDKYSALISKVSFRVKEENFWKNIGSIIQLSYSYLRDFEHTMEMDYKWGYYFDPSREFEEQEFYNCNEMDMHFILDGTITKLSEFKTQSRLIELLSRDDRAYTALSTLYASMQTHYCCLICELERFPFNKHPSHEPEIWEQASVIAEYETAIVQACRCVEAIIGKPPNKSNRGRLLQHKNKWQNDLGINADDLFKKAEMSYLDFYYKLFEMRNSAAHSYGTIPFDLERKQAVESQCFASLLLDGYILKNVLSEEEAIERIGLNIELLDKVDKSMSTQITSKES